MKNILLFLFICQLSYSQNGSIVGVSRTNVPNNVVYLAEINEQTGIVQDIAASSYSEYISNFTYTVDPDLDVFYYTALDNLIGIDLNTGLLVTDVPITTSNQPIFQSILYNEITQELIGLERGTVGGNEVYLSKINPQTGVVTPISQNSITDVISLNGGWTIDLKNQWYQFISNGQLLSVDISTGQIVHSPTIDTSQVAYFDNILFNANDNKIYGLGRNSNPPEILLGEIDPITGTVTIISQQSLSQGFALSGAALNPFTGVYYFQGIGEFIGASITTGDIFTSTTFDFSQSNGDYFDYYYFSGKTASLLSTAENEFNSSIKIFPNPVADVLNVTATGLEQIEIYDLNGKRLYQTNTVNGKTTPIDISAYDSSVYFIKLKTDKQIEVRKVIKR